MRILFSDKKFEGQCNEEKKLQKVWGEQAKFIRRRLDDMIAASNLETLRLLPQTRCHELTGNLAGKLSVDLKHPYRLILEPADEPIPMKDDGGLDWSQVTIVRILEVRNTHG